jgi:hypothetical protein
VFRAITALALLAASSAATVAVAATTTADSDTLLSSAPWWEKVTVTIGGDGKTQACRYESSLKPADAQECDISGPSAKVGASGSKAELTKITFERRFTPGVEPASPKLQTGDTLLGGQVMALAIGARGEVEKCEVVAASGAMKPDYGCAEATAERFDASVGSARKTAREGYMTILVYGHPEHLV